MSAESGQGGQWLAYVTHLVRESSIADVNVVPIGISYDCVPKNSMQVGENTHILYANTLQDITSGEVSGGISELT